MTYEYQCASCQEVFSVQMSLTEREKGEVTCPRCRSRDVDQRMTPFFTRTTRKAA